MACTSSPLRSLKRTIKKQEEEKKTTGLAVTNATETDTHTRTITWMFDGMQQCFFAIMTSGALFNLGSFFLMNGVCESGWQCSVDSLGGS